MAPLAQRRLGVTQVMAALVVWTMVLVVFFEYFGVQRLEKASDAKLEQLSASFEMEMASMRRAMAEQSERTAEREAKLPDALEAKHGASQLEHHAGFLQESGDGHPEHGRRDRRLALRTAVAAGSNTATSGCVTVTADTTFKMDTTTSNGCNSLRCPPCFIVTANSVTLTVESCSSALIGSSAMASAQVLEILYINTGTGTVTIQPSDGSASVGNPFYLDAYQTVTAYCYGGGSDRQYFPEQFYPFVQNFPGIRDSVAAGSNTAASSCVTVTSSTTFKMHTVTSNGCNGIRCPPCFMVTSGTATLTVQGCSDALVGNEVTAALGSGQILQIEYINAGSGTVTITPNTAGGSAVGNSYVLNAYERVTAYCYEGGSDRQHFPDQSESGGYCPEGCDATAPNNRAGTAFTTRNVADAATQTTLDTIAAITNVDSIAPSAFEEFPGIRNTVAAASNTATSDCVTVSATTTFKMHTTTTNGCNSVRCPPCFVVTSGTATLTVQGCSTALVGDATTSALGTGQILQIEYINAGSGTVTITPNTNSGSAVGNSYVLNAYERVTAYCYQGGSDRQHFPDQSESGGYCPEGCDATTPNSRAGAAFTTRNVADAATETTLNTIAGITNIDTIAPRVLAADPGGDISWDAGCSSTAVDCT